MSGINSIEPGDDHQSSQDTTPSGGERSKIGGGTALRRTSNPLKIIVPLVFIVGLVGGGYWFFLKNRADHLSALGNKVNEVNSNKSSPGATAGQSTSGRRTLGVDSSGALEEVNGGHPQDGKVNNGGSSPKDSPAPSGAGFPAPLSSPQALRQAGPGQPLMASGGSQAGMDPNNLPTVPRTRFDSSLVMQDGLPTASVLSGPSTTNRGNANGTSLGGGGPSPSALPAFPDLSKLMMPQNGASPAAATGAFGGQLTPSKTPKATAATLGNRSMVLAKGGSIDCVLDTAFSSDAPSLLSCTVTKNIFSDDGKVVLIDKGSKATGESGTTLKQGQTRVFVLWTRIKTPTGVIVDLDSPGADALGRGGITGEVDNHFMERFGAAFLVSMFQDAFAYAIAKTSSGSTSTSLIQNTQSSGNSLATEIVRNAIGIPPTLQKNQGERISISVARDLDFSNVYELKAN